MQNYFMMFFFFKFRGLYFLHYYIWRAASTENVCLHTPKETKQKQQRSVFKSLYVQIAFLSVFEYINRIKKSRHWPKCHHKVNECDFTWVCI